MKVLMLESLKGAQKAKRSAMVMVKLVPYLPTVPWMGNYTFQRCLIVRVL